MANQPGSELRYDGARAVSRITIHLLGAMAAWPIVVRALHAVTSPSGWSTGDELRGLQLTRAILATIEALLQLTAFVFFLVWFYRLYRAIREEQGATQPCATRGGARWARPTTGSSRCGGARGSA